MIVNGEATSSAVPKLPSAPARTRCTRSIVNRSVSMGSLNKMSNERTRNSRAPSTTLVVSTSGAKTSGTTVSVTAFDSVTLPPVSVARTCTVTVLPALAIDGTAVNSSNGNARSLDTTRPLTSSSTLRTCTSSLTVGTMRSVEPSCTWMPAVTGSASTDSTAIDTCGAMPSVSKAV